LLGSNCERGGAEREAGTTLRPSGLITLTTDFGGKDWFVGTMKGVVLGINPAVVVVDVTHEIPSGDVRAGAFALASSCSYFPRGTVHLAVVDPGVGSARKAIVVRTANYLFVGPNNGVLGGAVAKETIREIFSLENPAYSLQPISRTFHGRDVFAPAAAHLSRGLNPQKLGPRLPDLVRLSYPHPQTSGPHIQGEILYVDRFGNAITNIGQDFVPNLGGRTPSLAVCRRCRAPVKAFYQAVVSGRPVAVIGSNGTLEIAVNNGNASEKFGLRRGDPVILRASRR
jgi:S-adenosyl-L-methionine hydrolase (adenosine-forming)